MFGLIHSDLHQENYLFHRGRVRAIDFDDCGWGHFVYDLAVTLSELQHLPDSAALRAGLLRGYRAVRPLPAEHERYLEVFHALRVLKLTLWFLEQRDHPAFADWEADVRDGLADLRKLADRLASASLRPSLARQPARNDSRTRRTLFSRFGSTSTTLCHVPRTRRPSSTGRVSDGETNTGSRWSPPCPTDPCAWR